MVVSYLTWVTNEYRLSKRSRNWAQALYLAEAGLDVAMAELNFPYRTQGPLYAFQSANGWTAAGPSSYTKSVTGFTNATGAVVGDFSVTVANVGAVYCN